MLDWGRISILSISLNPPGSDDDQPWPCPACARFQPLERMRRVEVADPQLRDTTPWLLMCLDCIQDRSVA